jgi:hypothetical protein
MEGDMGRFFVWVIILAVLGFGAYVYLKDPDPATYRANATQAASALYAGAADLYGRAYALYESSRSDASEATETSETTDTAADTTAEDDSAVEPSGVEHVPDPPASNGAVSEQTLDQYRAWISEARATHPYSESEERMYAVMMCESEGRADVVNRAGPYSGLFQYSSAFWNSDWNTYRDQDILDPRAQIFATALAWSEGMQSHWGCYNRAH